MQWVPWRSSSSGGLARVQQRMEKPNDSDRMRGVNQATAGCERVERAVLQHRLKSVSDGRLARIDGAVDGVLHGVSAGPARATMHNQSKSSKSRVEKVSASNQLVLGAYVCGSCRRCIRSQSKSRGRGLSGAPSLARGWMTLDSLDSMHAGFVPLERTMPYYLGVPTPGDGEGPLPLRYIVTWVSGWRRQTDGARPKQVRNSSMPRHPLVTRRV